MAPFAPLDRLNRGSAFRGIEEIKRQITLGLGYVCPEKCTTLNSPFKTL